MRTQALISLLFTSTLTFAAVQSDYSHILNGKAPLTQETLDAMYLQFRSEHTYLPSSHYNSTGRKANFEAKVREVINHNKDETVSWKKGINEYSDMTEEEFVNYFNIKADQECSATKRPPASTNPEVTL